MVVRETPRVWGVGCWADSEGNCKRREENHNIFYIARDENHVLGANEARYLLLRTDGPFKHVLPLKEAHAALQRIDG